MDNSNQNKPKVKCEYPELGRNAYVNFNRTTGEIMYSCYEYMSPVAGTSAYIKCIDHNQWSGKPLECDCKY